MKSRINWWELKKQKQSIILIFHAQWQGKPLKEIPLFHVPTIPPIIMLKSTLWLHLKHAIDITSLNKQRSIYDTELPYILNPTSKV
jgi:hypothetical protein